MTISVLAMLAIVLTLAMFVTKERLLGFPCAIFWAVLAGMCYQSSAALWDIDYLSFFACIGMAIFSMYAAFALREKRDAIGDVEMDEETKDKGYIDEDKADPFNTDNETGEGKPSKRLHNRANLRNDR